MQRLAKLAYGMVNCFALLSPIAFRLEFSKESRWSRHIFRLTAARRAMAANSLAGHSRYLAMLGAVPWGDLALTAGFRGLPAERSF